jgi:hypothetical protein
VYVGNEDGRRQVSLFFCCKSVVRAFAASVLD